ncbi:MAG TPA: EAL domain-containing protein, partial [Bordetella sp.]
MPDQPLRPDGAIDTFQDNELYDPAWACILSALQADLRPKASAIAAMFYEQTGETDTDDIIGMLTTAGLQHLQAQQAQNLLLLASPDLSAERHRATALRIGKIHAIVGLTQKDLLRGQDILHTTLRGLVDANRHGKALGLLGRRLIRDLTWQTEAYQLMQAARYEVLLNLSQLVWTADNYTDLISQSAELLSQHPEIAACAFGKPDQDGIFQFEFMAGEPAMLTSLVEQPMPSLLEDETHTQGLTGRAWHTKQVQHCRNFETDERLAFWRERAARLNVQSFAAIPICHAEQPPRSILTLYSHYVGGYASADQQSFIRQIQSLLMFACARLEGQAGYSDTVPYAVRQRWARLIRSDALQMHYQPILELKTRRVLKVEALVRLHDGNQVIAPGTFFPALSSDDFFEIYARGLDQSLAQCTRWLAAGLNFCVSVNLPSKALADPRYLQVTRQTLARHGCPAGNLVLEILETDALPRDVDVAVALGRFKALGVG